MKNIKDFDFTELHEYLTSNNYHILLAGCTGSGKSVLLEGFLLTTLAKNTRDDIDIIICDPKIVGFQKFKKCKQIIDVATNLKSINAWLDYAITTMNKRYKYMSKHGMEKWTGRELLIILDEFADLVTGNKEITAKIVKLLRLGRAAKVRLVMATQAPSRHVISADIQLNCAIRIGLRCTNAIESKQIINAKGCEELPRYGSCLVTSPDSLNPYYPDEQTPVPFDVHLFSSSEQKQIIEYCKHNH